MKEHPMFERQIQDLKMEVDVVGLEVHGPIGTCKWAALVKGKATSQASATSRPTAFGADFEHQDNQPLDTKVSSLEPRPSMSELRLMISI